MRRKQNMLTYPKHSKRSLSSINCFYWEPWDLIDSLVLWLFSLLTLWEKSMWNRVLWISMPLIRRLLAWNLSSSFYSQEWNLQEILIRLLRSMDSWTRNSPFLWDRDKNLELKEHWRMLPNRELGSVWRTYSWCRIGSMESKDWKESWKPVIKMPILTSEPSSLLNHPPFHLWWTFLRVFSSLVWKCQMRTLRIWRPTWREPMPNSIRSSLIKPLSQMSSNLFYLHCASSTLWSVEERSSDHRDGARSTTSMMEIWLSVQMCSTTTWGTMMWCLTRIWDTSMVISCMEDISLMDGIEEPIELIYWPISSLNWCRIWV